MKLTIEEFTEAITVMNDVSGTMRISRPVEIQLGAFLRSRSRFDFLADLNINPIQDIANRFWQHVETVKVLLEPDGSYYSKQQRRFYNRVKGIHKAMLSDGLCWVQLPFVEEAQKLRLN